MLNFLLIASFEAVFIALLILLKRQKHKSDYILFVLFLVYALTISLSYVEILNRTFGYPYPFFISVSVPFIFLHGPLLWLYVMSLTRQQFKLRWLHALHLIPFCLAEIIFYMVSYRLPEVLRIEMDIKSTFRQQLAYPIFLSAIAISTLVYYSLGLVQLSRFRKNLKAFFAETENLNLQWLRVFLLLAMISHLSISVLYILDFSLSLMAYNSLQLSGFVVASVYTLVLGFYGFRQGNIFTSNAIPVNLEKVSEKPTVATPLSDPEALFIEQLMNHMKTSASYRKQELTLAMLASELNCSPEYLSSVLNGPLNMSFYDFVNHYRVEAFKEDCLKPESQAYTLLAVAYDCGFNSKATFNRVFKQMTGETPGSYASKKP